ncbi:glycosyltransferase [Halomonas mongoliensis]|uniref:Glycosyltransferase n=1 Tax=Halomonas mongoliensis TaxID=321265 RepID=A0ABU1GP85_9GAMM|nr:glycosyltransferase [Halomonas mongoliensis]MDR5893263.1 glycosyltransferase [Halomonas mongoliensis]
MSSSKPDVVVVCAWYNRADHIRDTVDSLLSQDFENFEVVIVNDGSTDPRVKEVLDSYQDSRLKIIHQENTGFVGAIRKAIETSSAPFIAIQGAGDVSYKARLREQYKVLVEDDSLCACGVAYVNAYISLEGVKYAEKTVNNSNRYVRKDFFSFNAFSHGDVMLRRESYERVGGYRYLFKYAQDRDLWLRIGLYGDFFIINDVLYERRVFSKDGVSSSIDKKIVQAALSDMAVQAALFYDKYGYDFVSSLDEGALVFRRRSKKVARSLLRAALIKLIRGDTSMSVDYAKMAFSERRSMLSMLVLVFCWVVSRMPYDIRLKISTGLVRFFNKKTSRYI